MNRDGLSPNARRMLRGNQSCIGTNRDGTRCRRAPMVLQLVCSLHGGRTPLALEKAQELLAGLRGQAVEVLYRATRPAPACKLCGRSDTDRDPTAVRAALAILDRTGLHPTVAMELNQVPETYSHLSLAELADHAERFAITCRKAADNDAARKSAAMRMLSAHAAEDGVLVETAEPFGANAPEAITREP